MRKSKIQAGYDKKGLESLVYHLKQVRRPLKDGGIPRIEINVDRLEETIKLLPKKERETLEHFWGLVPGTTNHSKRIWTRKATDVAYRNMMDNALTTIRMLFQIEYLYMYDKNVEEIVERFLTKIDKEGAEEISDIDAIKYLIIFLIFIVSGPRMLFEEGDNIDTVGEKNGHFDEYALLKTTWSESAILLPDHSIKLKLIIETINLFNWNDVITMKKFIRLPIEKNSGEQETETMESFAEVRRFKERIFPYGNWDVTISLIYGGSLDENQLESLADAFSLFRKDWRNVDKFIIKDKVSIKVSTGERQLEQYQIGDMKFNDVNEMMFLYFNRNLL